MTFEFIAFVAFGVGLGILAGSGAVVLYCIGIVVMAAVLSVVIAGASFGAAYLRRRADG